MPFWVSGSAAMKMTMSTSSTSMSGVMFMSALACGTDALTTFSAPKCWWARAMSVPPRSLVFRVGHEADVLDSRLAELVHRAHDGRVISLFVRLDEDDFLFRILEQLADAARQLPFGDRLRVQVELLVLADREDRLSLRFGLVDRVVGDRQPDADALLQQRRDDHHDDEQHQHDV